ncbi:MAG: UvrD-helicase domain-containing protein [Candidatus Paracaedibacteraceae bacterium]|nr:UvrD-helicase domain-containing protein [Candidatus Paracaedibacteraceae bacterium]
MSVAAATAMAPAATYPYLEALNDPQRHAVLTTDGALLVLAGAGTGKTRVLTTRIAHILNQRLAYPDQILAVTFTNKASQEMRERISRLLGHPTDGMWVGTFHSLAVRVLRRHAERVGLSSNFTILDSDDQLRLIKQLIKANHLDDKQFPPRSIAAAINRLKDKGLRPARAQTYENDVIIKLYTEYQERLAILNATDFGDLLLHNLTIFQENPEILKHYQEKFRYLLVDEYQDTNSAQYLWLRLLAHGASNICCVGDDDQSIYGWRGAEVGNILRFEKDFPGAVLIRLEQNYRSTEPILKAASGLIAHNRDRYGKTLWTDKNEGEPIRIRGTYDSEEEARYIGDEIETFQRNGDDLRSMAILVRAGFQTREFEERFMRMGIPYRVIGGPRFYERQEIRDSMAYLRLLVQADDGLAFERIINLPRRGIGDTTLQRLHQFAREQGISLPKAARFATEETTDEIPLRGASRTALRQFFVDLDRWRLSLETMSHTDVIKQMLDESGYTNMWLQDKSPDAAGRLENIKEFVQAISQFETLGGFLEHVSLVLDTNNPNTDDMVTLMTLHAAKGLEFDTVFLAGWEEGLFPHPRALGEAGGHGIEEERRLAYVGISRARKRALISYAYQRRQPQGWQSAQPSRFIREIPSSVVVHINPGGTDANDFGPNKSSSYGNRGDNYGAGQYNGGYERPVTAVNMRDEYGNKKSYYKDNQSSNYNPAAAKALTPRTAKAELLSVNHTFKTGDRVFHEKFGQGDVLAFEGDKLLIQFDANGLKKIIASFVERA